MYWNLQKDVFVFKLNESRVPKKVLEGARKLTKREYLRVVMSLFDPMGILGHLVVQAKIIIQNVWKSGIGWDEQLHDKEFNEWKIWWELVQHINSIEIPRHYGLLNDVTNVQLHLFMDASDKAFSVVAYWRLQSVDNVDVALIGSKTKVAPIKLLSIPRLELQGALLAKRFADTIQREHSIKPHQRFFWCDSKTVHCWLKSRGKDFKVFVALRVGEILDGTEANEWRYVPSKENVADVTTKANKELEVNNSQRWFKGPDFLRKGQEHWPKESPEEADETLLEIKSIHHISVADRGFSLIDADRFSSWNRLLRTTARVLKVAQLASERPFTVAKFVTKISEDLTLNDVAKAKEFLIKKSQWEAFPNDIKHLEEKKPIPNNSQLKTLSPYLEDGILRIKGRIDALHCGRDLKRPIILPRKHKVTFLIIQDLHKRFKHQLSEAVVNEMRQEFWVPRLRVEVNYVKNNCQECKNQKAKATVVEMSPLPNVRLTPFFRPFTCTGLDYFGPLEVVIGRRREKRWVALFTCLTIRAIHMELVYSLSADSCILALRSFINRRGCPRELLSDNATCFKGASKELKEAITDMDQSCLQEECTMKGISWQMIPPYSPHKGGAWERMVRSVKSVIGKVLYERALREETLRSFLTEAEQIINSRPLTYVPLDSEADPALTPNDFLLQSSNGLKEKWDFPEKLLRKQWKISQELADHFWNRWIREFAPTILKRPKWFEDERPLAVGDVVVVLDEKTARNNWVKGRVVELIPSNDGKIRTVKIGTERGIRVRSVSNLARLDLNSVTESKH
jgi:transposase InsO family protein